MLGVNKTLTKECEYLTFVLDSICNTSESKPMDERLIVALCLMGAVFGFLLLFILYICYSVRRFVSKQSVRHGHGASEFAPYPKLTKETEPLPSRIVVQILSFGGPIHIYRDGKTETIRVKEELGIQERRRIGQPICSAKQTEEVKKLLHYIHEH